MAANPRHGWPLFMNNSVHDTMNILGIRELIGVDGRCLQVLDVTQVLIISNVNTVSLSTGVYTVIAGNLGINLGGCKAARLCKLGSPGGFRVVVMGTWVVFIQ